jgi:hypothetical protein
MPRQTCTSDRDSFPIKCRPRSKVSDVVPLLRPRVAGRDRPGPGRVPIAGSGQDSLLAAVVMWIPVEVITVYKATMGIIPEARSSLRFWLTVSSILVTALWIAFATRPEGRRIAWRQVLLAPVAFTCWAVATQGDVVKSIYSGWEPWLAFLVLAAGTVLLPILDGILRSLGVPQN